MRFALALAVLVVGCGAVRQDDAPAQSDTAPGGGVTDKGSFQGPETGDPAPSGVDSFAPTFPRVINLGGQTIAHPVVQPIVFDGDPMTAAIADFTRKVAVSSYWQGIGAEYGVSAIAPRTPIELAESAPTTITAKQIETSLEGKLANPSQPLGVVDPSTLYIVYEPAGTTITAPELGTSCVDFGGYHGELDVNGVAIGYAVVPRCSDLDTLTVSASHEMFEWATNPFPKTRPAYARVDDAHAAWNVVMVGEIADLCTFLDRQNVNPPDIGYRVQRQWSNVLSQVGSFPCAPYDGIANFQAIPETPDLIGAERGIRIPKNGTRAIPVHLYSDMPLTGDLTLKVLTKDAWYGKPSTAGISASLSTTKAAAGSTVYVNLSATGGATDDVVILFARSGAATHLWPVHVVAQ